MRTAYGTGGRKELGLEAGVGPSTAPVVRLESGMVGGAAAGVAGGIAGSVDAVIGQFYFAKQLDPRPSPVTCLCHVPLTGEMWAGCQDGSVSVYHVDNYQLVEDREGNHEAITCMVFDNIANVWCGSLDSKASNARVFNSLERVFDQFRYTFGMQKRGRGRK